LQITLLRSSAAGPVAVRHLLLESGPLMLLLLLNITTCLHFMHCIALKLCDAGCSPATTESAVAVRCVCRILLLPIAVTSYPCACRPLWGQAQPQDQPRLLAAAHGCADNAHGLPAHLSAHQLGCACAADPAQAGAGLGHRRREWDGTCVSCSCRCLTVHDSCRLFGSCIIDVFIVHETAF
jgi:hypothetical protein